MNNKIRTLLIDSDANTINEAKKYFSSSKDVEVTYITLNGKDGLEYAIDNKNNIDLVVLDDLLVGMDSLVLLRKLKTINNKFKIILTCSIRNEYLFSKLNDFDVDYVFLKPYNFEDLESIATSIFNTKSSSIDGDLEGKITKMLHSLGVPSHIKGYNYIRESIKLIYKNPYIANGITKELYPSVAKTYNTTSSRVERAIRHAIEVSWNRGDYDYMEDLFGHSVDYDRAKPTNSEFIATVADRLRLDLHSFSH